MPISTNVAFSDRLLAIFDIIEDEPDPAERLAGIRSVLDEAARLAARSAVEPLNVLRAAGWTPQELADALGIPVGRADALSKGSRPPLIAEIDPILDISELLEAPMRRYLQERSE